ncbi:hypothetical protein [Sphingobium vermicomposti]|uniref:Uncharacterized protein n=1 Tax=Sphingobium vermicomposti TaxID=529005 RepID=A0A846M6L6_9SPHN|nr:hypothetical protein [Sphingobium vermicomposti]NIJ16281.1 hypothetical protein [Sphingobium vermicomposti]
MAKKTTRATLARKGDTSTGTALIPVKAHARALDLVSARLDVDQIIKCEGDTTLVVGQPYKMGNVTIQTDEVYYVDGARAGLSNGPWLGEADKIAWRDPVTGYDCIMMRDRDEGFLSGYVGVPMRHPLYGYDHKALPAGLGIQVHGGLSYSATCEEGPTPERRIMYEARRICHVAVRQFPIRNGSDHHVDDHAWWFGFECNHLYDLVPADLSRNLNHFLSAETGGKYRDATYVCTEVQNLAAQLRAIADGCAIPARRGDPLPPLGLDPQRGA